MAASMRNVSQRLLSRRFYKKLPVNSLSTTSFLTKQDYTATEEVEYPPIKPKYPPGKWGKLTPKQAWELHDESHEYLQETTAKFRLEKLAGAWNQPKPRLYKFKVIDHAPGFGTLPFKQFATKTHVVDNANLPAIYSEVDSAKPLERLRPLLSDTIEYQADLYNHFVQSESVRTNLRYNFAHALLGQLFKTSLALLSSTSDHLLRSQLDENVTLAAFWRRCGFDNPQATAGAKYGDIATFQMNHSINWQIRTELSLPEVIPVEDPLCQLGEIPEYKYAPTAACISYEKNRPFSTSGHWIGDPCEFGHITGLVANSVYDKKIEEQGEKHMQEETLGWGIATGFGSTVAQAHNQGFFHGADLTYPFVNQTVVTDGRLFRFFVYQLNTLFLWKDNDAQPTRNLMWASPQMSLYDVIEDGRVKGLNDNVLKHLIQFMLLEPQDRGVDMRPYLPGEAAPVNTKKYINHTGEEPLPHHKIGRFEYPRNSVYF